MLAYHLITFKTERSTRPVFEVGFGRLKQMRKALLSHTCTSVSLISLWPVCMASQ